MKAALAKLTCPLGWTYGAAMSLRNYLYSKGTLRRFGVPAPVFCIGNLSMGGTGKSPLVEYTVREILALGHSPAVISRGYRRETGARSLVLASNGNGILRNWREVGDEPAMLARNLPGVPVAVCSDRMKAAAFLLQNKLCDSIVLDDGFQHLRFRRNADIVLLDSCQKLENMKVFPSGTLRECFGGLVRAGALVHTKVEHGVHTSENQEFARRLCPDIPQFTSSFVPVSLRELTGSKTWFVSHISGKKVLAFAGIGNPYPFFQSLRELGAEVVGVGLPDHTTYDSAVLRDLCSQALAQECAYLVTTEKDAVKLLELAEKFDSQILVLKGEIRLDPAAKYRDLLSSVFEMYENLRFT